MVVMMKISQLDLQLLGGLCSGNGALANDGLQGRGQIHQGLETFPRSGHTHNRSLAPLARSFTLLAIGVCRKRGTTTQAHTRYFAFCPHRHCSGTGGDSNQHHGRVMHV